MNIEEMVLTITLPGQKGPLKFILEVSFGLLSAVRALVFRPPNFNPFKGC